MSFKSSLLCLLCVSASYVHAESPINENILHLTGSIGTSTYDFSIPQTACCVSTSTLLDDIREQETTIASKIDNLALAQATGYASAFTALADIRNQETTIVTKIDNLALAQAACCVSTSNLLNDVRLQETTIATKIDNLALAQATCCTNTFTVLADIRSNLSSGGGSSGCASTPLTIAATGTTIATPGVYCLNNDVSFSSPTATIAITSSNVVFDLNGHTITGSGFGSNITIPSSASPITDIIIRNGTISAGQFGVSCVSALATNIVLEHLTINDVTSSSISINGASTNNLLIKNIIMSGSASSHVNLGGSKISNGIIDSCTVYGAGSNTIAFQYLTTTPASSILFTNCMVSNSGFGFTLSGIQSAILDNCIVLNSANTGFNIATGSSGPTTCTYLFNNCFSQNNPTGYTSSASATRTLVTEFRNCRATSASTASPGIGNGFSFSGAGIHKSKLIDCLSENNINTTTATDASGYRFIGGTGSCFDVQNCVADNNSGSGFLCTQTAASTLRFNLQNCTATGNNGNGFNFNQSVAANITGSIINCIASNNFHGFNFTGLAGASLCSIGNCIAIGNLGLSQSGIGFIGSGTNTAVFFNNESSQNGTAGGNYQNLGSESAPEVPFSAITRSRGDNLKNS